MMDIYNYYQADTVEQNQLRYKNKLVDFKYSTYDKSNKIKILPDEIVKILLKAGKIGTKIMSDIYLVGGMTRDLLLERENRDLDFVVSNNLPCLIEELSTEFDGEGSYNEKFHTGSILTRSGFNLDFATFRQEYYPYPASLPLVKFTENLKDDLFRRDFTVNTMVLNLHPDRFGQLEDYFGGIEDLNKRRLQVIHSFSFYDDPTRIIRGLRLMVEYGLSPDERTKRLLIEVLRNFNFIEITPVRVINELRILLERNKGSDLTGYLRDYPIFRLLQIDFEIKEEIISSLQQLEEYLAYYREKKYNIREWLLRLAVFLKDVSPVQIDEWDIKKSEKDILKFPGKIKSRLNIIKNTEERFALYKVFQEYTREECILLLTFSNEESTRDKIKIYLEELSRISIDIDGFILQDLGLKAGPEMREVLDRILAAKISGKINNTEEELKLARDLIKERNGRDK